MPGHFLYTFIVQYNSLGQITRIAIYSRKITRIKLRHSNGVIVTINDEGDTTDLVLDLHTESSMNKYFTTTATFTYGDLDLYQVRTNVNKGYNLIYCFSEEIFLKELNEIIDKYKNLVNEKQMITKINQYYNDFKYRVMKMIYTKRSGIIEINL